MWLSLDVDSSNLLKPFSFAFTHLSYGVLKGYDEKLGFTKNYNSSSSRLSSTYAEKIKHYPVFVGSNISWVLTNLDNKQQGNTVAEMVNEMFKLPGHIIRGTVGCDN